MSQTLNAQSIGPVDVAVLLFEGSKFTGEIASNLSNLHDQGIVHVIDLAFVRKDPDGKASAIEVGDTEVADAFERIAGEPMDLLNDEDLDQIAAGLEPDSSALVIVWENTWAAHLATAVRQAHGQLIALERIPREDVLRAIAALEEG